MFAPQGQLQDHAGGGITPGAGAFGSDGADADVDWKCPGGWLPGWALETGQR